MSGLLPTIDELAAAKNHVERAQWLLQTPPSTLFTYHLEIRAVLQSVGFTAGLTALAAEIAWLLAVRDRHGYTPVTFTMSRNIARSDLGVIAYGGSLGEVLQ
ncbi:hypothetical protein V3589_02665 [Sinorhizobium fredii]|uniref:hypothetical protein n=1 Tax=Rhizobium fredii TaxID=380 RepID=UPI0030A3F7A9